ncbi:hypothetical protein QNH32_08675 [Priestia flexa]|nr:hypothetical protein [Priestia flexa]WHX80643.1 hypothetical protein QNH32_08675 [Priestia flexa]
MDILFGFIAGLFIYKRLEILLLGFFTDFLVGGCIVLFRWWKESV